MQTDPDKVALMEEALFGDLTGKAAEMIRYRMAGYFDRIGFDDEIPRNKPQPVSPWCREDWWATFRMPAQSDLTRALNDALTGF